MTPPDYPAFTGFEPCATIDPETYFQEKGQPGYVSSAVLHRICIDRCHMQPDCLEWALWNETDGFWGGTSPRERRALRKELGIVRIPSRHLAA